MLELIEPVAKRFDQEGKFLGICFGRSSLCECMPVRVGKLGAIRVAGVGHARTHVLPIGATNPCFAENAFWLGTVCTLIYGLLQSRPIAFLMALLHLERGEIRQALLLSAASSEHGDPML